MTAGHAGQPVPPDCRDAFHGWPWSICGAARGFTFIELLIVVVLAALLGATLLSLFRYQNRVFRSENQSVEMDQNVRAGLDLMLRELRNAGMKDPLRSYVDPPRIVAADSQSIRFTMDFHSTTAPDGGPDGDVLDANEDIEYSYTLADRTLRRRTRGSAGDSGAQPMAEFVTRVRFDYFDASAAPIASPVAAAVLPNIRRIKVTVSGAAPDGGSATTLESDVAPRNLAY